MKKLLIAAAAIALSTSAVMAENYNRVGISYDNTHYGYNKEYRGDDPTTGFSTNGFGLNYIHGWQITSMPLYLEAGLNFNMNFYGKKDIKEQYDDFWYQGKENFQNMNFQVPVNIGYRFMVANDLVGIQPFVGLNFKLNLVSKSKYSMDSNDADYKYDGEWLNYFSSDEKNMGSSDATWNRFQMGWQIGVTFSYKPVFFTVQYGTDFIPAYSHKFEYIDEDLGLTVKSTPKINTGNLKLTVGYTF